MIQFGKDKIELLSAYLHDALLTLKDIEHDEQKRILKMELSRIYYEEPQKGKFLFLIPIIR